MKKNYLIILTGCFFFLLSSFLLVFFIWQGIYLPKTPGSQQEIVFSIKKGEGTKEISFNLKKEGLIKSGLLFRVYTFFNRISRKLQAGKYLLSPSMTIPEIAKKIVVGDVIKQKITIIEGWNKEEIVDYLQGKGIADREEFLIALNLNWQDEYDFLKDKPVDQDIEGYLFPDTYLFAHITDSTIEGNAQLTKEEKIIEKMLDNFGRKLTQELREEIDQQGKTIFEIVTMASMLEKEVKTFEDKELVSGILWKRLGQEIPLQVDATIIYITGKKTTKISKQETEIDSPYNTYKYKGLPIGPISNPGLESILAAIYPEESPFWYYLSTSKGETIFSKTLREHNLVKAKYLQ